MATTPKRRAHGRLRTFVDSQQPAHEQLPFIHTTRAYVFDDMLDSGGLSPTKCEFMKEDLIYLFYGRPAYRAKDGCNARLEFEWPIVFIFDPNKIDTIKRIFPFDSGAFCLGLYKEFFDNRSELEDFALTPTIETVKKVVSAFYRDNAEYYTGLSRKNVDIPTRQFEAQGLHELARLPGVQGVTTPLIRRDDRSSAIEIQVADRISFTDALLRILLPEAYFDDDEVKDALHRWKVREVGTYLTLHNQGGEAWVGQIYALVKAMYEKMGYI